MINQSETEPKRNSTFQFRLFLAAFLFALLVVMERSELMVAGITAEKVAAMISADIEDKLAVWANTLVD